MIKSKFVTYAFYDKRGRRLAIFYEENGMSTIIPCSKKDQFSKKVANNFYNSEVLPPSAIKMQMRDNMTQREFVYYCASIFMRLYKDERIYLHSTIIDILPSKSYKLHTLGSKVIVKYVK